MKILLIVLCLTILSSSVSFAHDYIRFGVSAQEFQDIFDRRYVKKSGDEMEGILDFAGFDIQIDGNDMRFEKVDDRTLKLYVNNTLIHTWSVPTATFFMLLDDGTSKVLLSDGTSFLLIR